MIWTGTLTGAVHKIKENKQNLERFWMKRSKYFLEKMKALSIRIIILQDTFWGLLQKSYKVIQ